MSTRVGSFFNFFVQGPSFSDGYYDSKSANNKTLDLEVTSKIQSVWKKFYLNFIVVLPAISVVALAALTITPYNFSLGIILCISTIPLGLLAFALYRCSQAKEQIDAWNERIDTIELLRSVKCEKAKKDLEEVQKQSDLQVKRAKEVAELEKQQAQQKIDIAKKQAETALNKAKAEHILKMDKLAEESRQIDAKIEQKKAELLAKKQSLL